MIKTDVNLLVGGRFSEPEVETEVKQYPGWQSVHELGFLDRQEVYEVFSAINSRVSFVSPVTPIISNAQPNKNVRVYVRRYSSYCLQFSFMEKNY